MSDDSLGLFFVGRYFTLITSAFILFLPKLSRYFIPLLYLLGALSVSSPSPHSDFYGKVSRIKVTVDTVLALMEGHFQQKNSGLCLCITEFCSGTCKIDESRGVPAARSSVQIQYALAEGHPKTISDF